MHNNGFSGIGLGKSVNNEGFGLASCIGTWLLRGNTVEQKLLNAYVCPPTEGGR